jgi:hypothetical protein
MKDTWIKNKCVCIYAYELLIDKLENIRNQLRQINFGIDR